MFRGMKRGIYSVLPEGKKYRYKKPDAGAVIKERSCDHQVLGIAMETCLIQLVGTAIGPDMRVLVVRYQAMQGDLRRNAEGKK